MEELAHDPHAVVSSDDDLLILVNEDDEELGAADKASCHDNNGVLHRAFSILIFNSNGDLLLQKRSSEKRLWGDFWSNSCCSHPRKGETMEYASHRRLWEELGLRAELTFLYKFKYQATFGDAGAEHELCWVYIGVSDDTPSTNAHEISEWRYVSKASLDHELETQPQNFTPWFKLEWEEIHRSHGVTLSEVLTAKR
ncbi:isopentenyl-diphosphate Delta-isomerase [Teredinibacter turnerae]|uniref:isopentenyl-diphosphate Delta-isomerase n=1 Tax=Teredinibacter turnerae TaxID=2426 RepID=UPI00036CB184|nr:isopentenyl-diphosphate Delta-isomerase [Teredinibacter turnerae]